jgi:hypothetical protein
MLAMTTKAYEKLALEDFNHARRKALWRDRISWLTRKRNLLFSLDETSKYPSHQAPRHLGLQAVPIDKIVGSEGRFREFDRAFLPRQLQTRDRWVNIAKAYYEQVTLPPVELLKIGDGYFVRDGNHRISVARSRGQDFVDADVTEIEADNP